jgi:hypothetical protein
MSIEEPAALADAAQQDALDLLKQASDADGALDTGRLEDEAIETLAEGVGKALAQGLNAPAGRFAAVVGKESEYYTKTDAKQKIREKSEEYARQDRDKQPLCEYLQDELNKVVVHRISDAKQGAHYSWHFGNFQVQTRSGKDGREHFNWDNFRNYIHESGGVNVAKPDKERRSGDDWREFVIDLIDERGETRQITGPRTRAVNKLRNRIRGLAGYETPQQAVEWSGVWVVTETDDLPMLMGWLFESDWNPTIDDVDVREVRVHETLIQNVVEEVEITRQALYQELDAKENGGSHTVPGSGGPSMQKYVYGDQELFWTLLPSIGLPESFVPAGGERSESDGEDQTMTDSESNEGSTTTTDDDAGGFDSVGEIA